MNNYIYEYYQAIKEESVTVGWYIKAWYEYIVKGLENKDFRFDQKKANKAIKFIESFCHHQEGELAPGLLKLELWQKAMLSVIYGIVDEEENRQFREIFIVVARKNGKSLLLAAIETYEAFLGGEYGGKIYSIAPKLEQANIIYDGFWHNVEQEPELLKIAHKSRAGVEIKSTNTKIKPLAFNAKKSDGLNPSLVICDEISSWTAEAGNKQYGVLSSARGARKQPLLISITTAGYMNDGPYDRLMNRATQLLKGNSKEKRLAPFLYIIDYEEKWNEINELRKSNPNLGISVTVDYLLEEIAKAEGDITQLPEFKTKYCNLKQTSSQAWLSAQTINNCVGKALQLEDFRSSYAVGGIDLSKSGDLTACVVVIEKEGVLNVFPKFFIPGGKLEEISERDQIDYSRMVEKGELVLSGDNIIDYHDCFNWFVRLVEEYEILPLKIGFDKWMSDYLVQDLRSYGFHCDDVQQYFNLSPVLREMQGLMEDGKINIGDSLLMQIHMADAAVETAKVNNKIRLTKIQDIESFHIDGLAALTDALTVRQKFYDEIGEQLKNIPD